MTRFTVPDRRAPVRFEGPTPELVPVRSTEVDRYRAEYRRLRKQSEGKRVAGSKGNGKTPPPPSSLPADCYPLPADEGIAFHRRSRLWSAEVDGRSLGEFATRELARYARTIAIQAEPSCAKGPRRESVRKDRGVYFDRRDRRWRAYRMVDGRRVMIPRSFGTKAEAIEARDGINIKGAES